MRAPQRALGTAKGAALMFSVPPATTMSASPALMICAASETLRRPEPQTLLMVSEGTCWGMPAWMATCRPTLCP